MIDQFEPNISEHLRRTIDCIVMLSWLAISSNCHHHQRFRIYYHAVRSGIVWLWRMCLVVVVCKRLADVPIPTFVRNHLGHPLSTTASTDERTFVLYCRLYVLKPFEGWKWENQPRSVYNRNHFEFDIDLTLIHSIIKIFISKQKNDYTRGRKLTTKISKCIC